MKIRLVTVVWGDFFVDIFLRVTVRSLLAAGNAADLARHHSVIYTIQTTPEDRRKLEASLHFQELAASVPIDFQVFNPSELNPADLAQHWYFWRQVAEIARPNGELLFFVIPDMLFGAGTLMRWAGFFEAGRHAVWTSVPQVVLETSLEELEQRFPTDGTAAISMDVTNVHQFFLRQMHPYMLTMFRDGRRWLRHPEIVFKNVPGEGLAMRAMCSHLFCIDLNHFTITDAFSPVDRLEDIAYDQTSHGVCLERLMKHSDLYYRPKQMDSDRLSNLGKWLDDFCTPADMLESYHTYRFSNCADNDRDSKGFKRAAASLGFYACQVRLTGSIYRMIRAMRGGGCNLGARIVAAAHYVGRLRRHWRIKGEATLFVPSDASIEAGVLPSFRDLLAPGNEKTLVDMVLAHVAPGKLALAAGDRVIRHASGMVTTLGSAGTSDFYIAERGPSAVVLGGPIEVDDCYIYIIDKPLKWPAAPNEVLARPAVLPNRWSSSPRRVMVPITLPDGPSIAPSSTVDRTLRGRIILKIKSTIDALPFMGRLARKALSVLRRARHPRSFMAEIKALLLAISARLRHNLPARVKAKLRTIIGALYRRATALPVLGPLVHRLRDTYYAKRQAMALAKRVVTVETMESLPIAGDVPIASSAVSTAPTDVSFSPTDASITLKIEPSLPKLSPDAVARFYDVQAAQIVLNLAELLRFYRRNVGDMVPDYPPLEMVERCLDHSGIDQERLALELRMVLDTQPDFAEAWLEFGYVNYELGRKQLAEQCWVECVACVDYIAVPVDRVGCKALASFARGDALEARGRLAAAAEAYSDAVARDVRIRMAHLANGKVLRRLGRIDEALVQFEASLDTDGAAAPFGKLPRTFEGLSSRLLARFPKAANDAALANQTASTGASTASAAKETV